jgi:hypothetical protein
VVDEDELLLGAHQRHELVPDQVGQLLDLREAGVVPQRVRQRQEEDQPITIFIEI